MKNYKVLLFTSVNHPLISQIYNELKIQCKEVVLTGMVGNKEMLKKMLLNFSYIIKNLKQVIQFSEVIFKNFKNFGIITNFRYYTNLIHLLILDKKYNFDIIDVHWIFPAGYLATIYSKYFPKKIIMTAHGYDADERSFSKPNLKKLILKSAIKADGILTAEERLYNNLRNEGIKKIILTNQFVELPELEYDILKIKNELSIPLKSFVIGFGPHLKKMYGLDDFVNAILLIKKNIPDLFVLCIGDGELKNHALQIFKKENLMYKITGKISHSEVLKHLMTCDIVCNPTYITQGIFTLEAFSCFKPVIGYEDIEEVKIKNNVTGLLTKSGNIEEFSDLLLKLYQDPNLREKLGITARRIIEENYTKEKRINDILKIYESIKK